MSLLPLSISAVVINAWPVTGSSSIVMSCVKHSGITLSSTVTVAVQVETLPLLSVTVRVTVFEPTSAHPNVSLSNAKDAIPQASLLPLSI